MNSNLSDRKMRVTADKYNQYVSMFGDFMGENVIPVDMNGRRVFTDKNNPDNLANAAQDIQEFYDLTGKGGLQAVGSSMAEQPKELRKVDAE